MKRRSRQFFFFVFDSEPAEVASDPKEIGLGVPHYILSFLSPDEEPFSCPKGRVLAKRHHHPQVQEILQLFFTLNEPLCGKARPEWTWTHSTARSFPHVRLDHILGSCNNYLSLSGPGERGYQYLYCFSSELITRNTTRTHARPQDQMVYLACMIVH